MNKFNLRIFPILVVIFAVVMRLIPHPANVAPIAALALFSGVYLPKRYALILPLVALVISDLFIGFYGTTMYFVYGSFLLTVLIGFWVKKHKNILTIIGGSLVGSMLFYLITNFAVWIEPNSWYSKDLTGLIQSYTLALPFFRNTLLGDLFFVSAFFGIYELALRFGKRYLPQKLFRLAF